MIASLIPAPSRVIRSASHFGTWPPCNGRSALPALRAISGLLGIGTTAALSSTIWESQVRRGIDVVFDLAAAGGATGDRQTGSSTRGYALSDRRGPLRRRYEPAGPSLRVCGALAARACQDRRHRCRPGSGHAGCLGGADGPRSGGGRAAA